MTLRHDRDDDLHFGQDSAEVITLSEPISGIPAGASVMEALRELFDRTVLLENGTPMRGFVGDAVLKKTLSASFTGDARVILPFTSVYQFTGDAVIGTAGFSFTGDAVLKRTMSASFTGDAITRRTATGSFTGSAITLRTTSGSLTADSVIASTSTMSGSFTANAVLKKTQSGSLTGDAVVAGGNQNARVSAAIVEALTAIPTTTTVVGAGVSEDVVEVLLNSGSAARVSENLVEVLASSGSAARVSEEHVEVLTSVPATTTVVGAGVSEDVVEVLLNTGSATRVSADIIEVLGE